CRRLRVRRHGAGKAPQTRRSSGTELYVSPECSADCGDALPAERWTLSDARSITSATATEDAGGAHGTARGAVAIPTSVDDLRGCALGRPNEPRSARSHTGPAENA